MQRRRCVDYTHNSFHFLNQRGKKVTWKESNELVLLLLLRRLTFLPR
jgi:hypothetical protein